MKKILFIFGTRPEAIKIAPVYNKFLKNKKFKTYVCITSQHKKMLSEVIDIFGIKVDYDLNIMKKNQDIEHVTTSILKKLNNLFKIFSPDLVIVHGDTTTTFSASLSAFYNKIKVAHIEAGLRSNNLLEPYPEEFNRKITSILSNLHFAPTFQNKKNLLKEGIKSNRIYVTGNTVIDSIYYLNNKAKSDESFKTISLKKINKLLNFDITNHNYILITCHRRENFGNTLSNICDSLIDLAKKFKSYNFVYPVHLNPNVFSLVTRKLSKISNIYLIPPQNYINFYFIMKFCYLVITDSGGLQEEAPSLNKPLIIIRNITERNEIILNRNGILAGTEKKNIIYKTSLLIENKLLYKKMSLKKNPYGNGNASEKIMQKIEKYFNV